MFRPRWLLPFFLAAFGFSGPGPASAARPKAAVKSASALLAEPKEGAAIVAQLKVGEQVTVLGAQGDWSNVMTAAAKKGWLKSSVIGGGKATTPTVATTGTQVAASESSTSMAIRGKPTRRRTAVVGTGSLPEDVVKRVGDLLRQNAKFDVIAVRSEAGLKPGSPAGGIDGAQQLAGGDGAELVVALAPGPGRSLGYEIVDLKRRTVLSKGSTPDSTDPRVPVEAVAAAAAASIEAAGPAPTAAASPVATKTAPHPNAPLVTGTSGAPTR